MAGRLAEHAGLGHRVVPTQGGKGAQVVFPGVHRSAAINTSQWAARPSLYFQYAYFRSAPEAPLGGVEVPKTGVTKACSMDRSREPSVRTGLDAGLLAGVGGPVGRVEVRTMPTRVSGILPE
jgi:hypothetical protein